MADGDWLDGSLTAAASALRKRAVSSLELTQAAIGRAKAINSRLNAFVRIDEEAALAAARRADDERSRGRAAGSLAGVPMAHKDMFYRTGQISTCGSALRRDWRASVTAAVLDRLDAAGAIQIGTLNMTEFAYGPTGQNVFLGDARNPWNADFITGGSSSGSGVAVAAGAVFAALGSDTGGSVRCPAAICGVVGMKTTFGRVSRYGAMPLSGSLDTVGPLTRSVADNALMLQVLAGHDSRDASTAYESVPDYLAKLKQPVKRLRVGRPVGYFDEGLARPAEKAWAKALRVFKELGCEIVDVPMPDLEAVNAAGVVVNWAEVNALHAANMREHANDYAPTTRSRLQLSLAATSADYLAALQYRGPALREFCDHVFSQCDALCAPTLSIATPRISDLDMSGGSKTLEILAGLTRLFRPANFLGIPSLALPAGLAGNGLPVAVQLMGRPFAEPLLYRLGAQFERELDWHERPPLERVSEDTGPA